MRTRFPLSAHGIEQTPAYYSATELLSARLRLLNAAGVLFLRTHVDWCTYILPFFRLTDSVVVHTCV